MSRHHRDEVREAWEDITGEYEALANGSPYKNDNARLDEMLKYHKIIDHVVKEYIEEQVVDTIVNPLSDRDLLQKNLSKKQLSDNKKGGDEMNKHTTYRVCPTLDMCKDVLAETPEFAIKLVNHEVRNIINEAVSKLMSIGYSELGADHTFITDSWEGGGDR